MKTVQRLLSHRFGLVALMMLIYVVISGITRVALLLNTPVNSGLQPLQLTGIFGIGLFYDLAVSIYLSVPLVLYLWLVNDRVYVGKWVWVVAVIYMVAIMLFAFTDLVPREFNETLYKVVLWMLVIQFLKFLFFSYKGRSFRNKWRKYFVLAGFYLFVFLMLFNAASEWFFWNEFSSRYNFIAVDYLVYTTEVIGNIRESYPVELILAATALITVAVLLPIRKTIAGALEQELSFGKRTSYALFILLLPLIVYAGVSSRWKHFSSNAYANELSGNGLFDFGVAFRANELDYYRYYKHMPDQEAFRIIRDQLASPYSHYIDNGPFSIEREIDYPTPEKKMNVVLISVESLTAEFMKAFGSQKNITPSLDSLAEKSLFFTNLYASGTRTVRGLEALSLSIPPTPGQSVIKRPGNENLFSLASVFKSKGYISQYIYGGYGYFDNMNQFFASNHYEVIDRKALAPGEIHYSNIWGVADEDIFSLTLKTLDNNYNSHKPFFTHIMTVSNHRPYTYPEGRIDIPPSRQVREGAVKYTDYAIGNFLKQAAAKPWFNNTLFVIVADHCAGSAGRVAIPVTGYHIPLIIYNPSQASSKKIDRLMAQIDVAPTILGLLSFDYRSKFFGRDIFTVNPRDDHAFLSTYEGLGYLKSDRMVVQWPINKIEMLIPDFKTGNAEPVVMDDSLIKEATAWYQCASWVLKNKRYTQ